MLYHAKIGGRTIMMQALAGEHNFSFSAHRVFLLPFLRWNCGKKLHAQQVNTTSEQDKHTIIIEKTYIVFTIDMLDKDKLE